MSAFKKGDLVFYKNYIQYMEHDMSHHAPVFEVTELYTLTTSGQPHCNLRLLATNEIRGTIPLYSLIPLTPEHKTQVLLGLTTLDVTDLIEDRHLWEIRN